MADSFQTIVDRLVTLEEAPRLAAAIIERLVQAGIVAAQPAPCTHDLSPGYPPGPHYRDAVVKPDPTLESLLSNGLEVTIGRSIGAPAEEPWSLFCPLCNTQAKFGSAWDRAMNDWWSGRSTGLLQCSACRQARPVTAWRYEPSWGFGYLSLTFWNWPPLKEEFVTDLVGLLKHEAVFLSGKL